MEIRDDHGLRIAQLAVDEALEELWRSSTEPIDVVRIPAPAPASRAELERRGYVLKPDFVSWLAEPGRSDEAFLAGLPKKDRYNARTARDRARDRGLRITVEQPLAPETLDQFLEVYRHNIGRLERGVPVAVSQREQILGNRDRYYGVYVWHGDQLIAGCLGMEGPEEQAVRVRFSAVEPAWRRADLTRVAYLEAIRVARDKGYPRVSLGGEPNLYGHIVQPGLYSYKTRFGFRPVSSQVFPGHGGDEADLVLSLRNLHDPSLVLAYGADGELRPTLFTTDPDCDARPYGSSAGAADVRHLAPTG